MNKKQSFVAVILAAGKGKRMQSTLPKVMHTVGGKPMLNHVIDRAKELKAERIICILGHGRQQIIEQIADLDVEYVIQTEQLGTGHAVQQTENVLQNYNGDILILSGDVPLLTVSTLNKLVERHYSLNAGATLLTAKMDDPSGYGRVVRDSNDKFERIVEHKDCNSDLLTIKEINAGVYIFKSSLLFKYLKSIKNDNIQNEYYLPDVLPYIIKSGVSIELEIIKENIEISGINTKEQLYEINRIFESRN